MVFLWPQSQSLNRNERSYPCLPVQNPPSSFNNKDHTLSKNIPFTLAAIGFLAAFAGTLIYAAQVAQNHLP
ncbi:MAG: hypothetical protein UR89_C0008G0014 [Candidatus Roizmanbacteria bacterium GW2011_GWA2_35_8]|uniref:Uncharacterized protein n=1 Tax=Candidatus Roizmanbacteria bacterium GW2011_GWA2_35_8 TaxID=1618479 RepID=A0A0G0G5M9_9BACT|nr:MAG: hypothetical protein UR89_C0008G0014 [Candidatus Roizmanbacteria bacterium GW2011_GWA2_35_8]